MTDVGKDGSIFGVSQELDIDLSNYYTKAQAERQKYSVTIVEIHRTPSGFPDISYVDMCYFNSTKINFLMTIFNVI